MESSEGITSFEYACISKNLSLVRFLLKFNPDINHFNKGDMTPLMTASAQNFSALAKLLIKKGADVNLQNSNGDTALMFSIYANSSKTTTLLLKNGADPFIKNNDGLSAFDIAGKTELK